MTAQRTWQGTDYSSPVLGILDPNEKAVAYLDSGGAPCTSVYKTAVSYTAKVSDSIIEFTGKMDGSQGITLPTTGLPTGKIYTIKVASTDTSASALNVFSGNAAEYAGNPQLYTIPAGAAVGGVARFFWDGTAHWLIQYSQ